MDARGELGLVTFKARDVDDEDSVTIGSVPEPVISIRRGVLGPFVGVDQVTVGGKEDVPVMRCRCFVLQGGNRRRCRWRYLAECATPGGRCCNFKGVTGGGAQMVSCLLDGKWGGMLRV